MFNLIKNIDHEQFQVDVVIKNGDVIDPAMLSGLQSFGSQVFVGESDPEKRMGYLKNLFVSVKGKYDIMHINATSRGAGIISFYAKHYAKIPYVIFHSHMGGNDNKKPVVNFFGFWLMKMFSDKFVACSLSASKFMFGKHISKSNKVNILSNSVDTKKFGFDTKIREKIRAELGIKESKFVILHVGRFAPQKNHKLLIDVFENLSKKDDSATLLLIGDGELINETKEYVSSKGLSEKVMFLGLRENVNEFMQASDCFVMTSIHEGLPIVAVEAQSTGLPCVLSKNISTETKLADNVCFVGLDESLDTWSEKIEQTKLLERSSGEKTLKFLGFDETSAIKVVEDLYKNAILIKKS
jgi:glycosyltransferase involved in cell wall biosynthesis